MIFTLDEGFLESWGDPNGWMVYDGTSIHKWMITRGTPICGNHQIEILIGISGGFYIAIFDYKKVIIDLVTPSTMTGWWLGHPSEKYEFVNWDD